MAAFLTEIDLLHRLGGASLMEECHLKEPKAETLIRIRPFRRVLKNDYTRPGAAGLLTASADQRLKGYRTNARKSGDFVPM
jgi:hypothetical protein